MHLMLYCLVNAQQTHAHTHTPIWMKPNTEWACVSSFLFFFVYMTTSIFALISNQPALQINFCVFFPFRRTWHICLWFSFFRRWDCKYERSALFFSCCLLFYYLLIYLYFDVVYIYPFFRFCSLVEFTFPYFNIIWVYIGLSLAVFSYGV